MSKKKFQKAEEPIIENSIPKQGEVNDSSHNGTAQAENACQSQTDVIDEQTISKENGELESLKTQLEESKDKYLRLSAEFDNYRKRTQREKMDLLKYGAEDAMKAILPVIDDFERAIKSTQNTTDIEAVKQGLALIQAKFMEFLKANGVKEIEAIGLDLDTDVHEAITKIPIQDEKMKGKIVDVVEKGYKLNDKVIRFSKVVVGE